MWLELDEPNCRVRGVKRRAWKSARRLVDYETRADPMPSYKDLPHTADPLCLEIPVRSLLFPSLRALPLRRA